MCTYNANAFIFHLSNLPEVSICILNFWRFLISAKVLISNMLILCIGECLPLSLCDNTKIEVEIIDNLVSCLCYSYFLSN